MKTLPQEVTNTLEKSSDIRPGYLIEIDLDERRYLSTGVEYKLGETTYESGHVQNLRVAQDTVTFGIVNQDYRYTTPALMGVYQRAPVKVYWSSGFPLPHLLVEEGYVEEGYYDIDNRPDPILIFEGNISRFTQITSILGVEATRQADRMYPTLRVLPPLANYVRTEGTVFRFGENTMRIEPRDK